MFYDEMLHSTMLAGFVALTNFGWIERTMALAAASMAARAPFPLLSTSQTVSRVFVLFAQNFTLLCLVVGAGLALHL